MDWRKKPVSFFILISGIVILACGIIGIFIFLIIPSPLILVASIVIWVLLGTGILMGIRFFNEEHPKGFSKSIELFVLRGNTKTRLIRQIESLNF